MNLMRDARMNNGVGSPTTFNTKNNRDKIDTFNAKNIESDQKMADKIKKNDAKENILYKKTDSGPFMVYVEADKIGKMSHLRIAKKIFDLKLENVKNFRSKGKNRISVEFKRYDSANNFLTNNSLNKDDFKTFIPYNLVTCKGVVKGVDPTFPDEELLDACTCPYRILGMKRMNRREYTDGEVTYIPTGTVVFTFEGVILPRYVELYSLVKRVTPYVAPVTQCYSCYRYGHTKMQCKAKKGICRTCGGTHENTLDNTNTECELRCVNCGKDDHDPTHKQCPERIRQQVIKQLMAYENLTYYDANERLPKNNDTNYEYDPRNFPTLPNRTQENAYHVNQRKIISIENSQRKRPRRDSEKSPIMKAKNQNRGYDRKIHNEQLISPNSRLPPEKGGTALTPEKTGKGTYRAEEVELMEMDLENLNTQTTKRTNNKITNKLTEKNQENQEKIKENLKMKILTIDTNKVVSKAQVQDK